MDGFFKRFLSQHSVTIAIWTLGILFALLNLYITSQLAPLNENLTILATKVEAMQNNQTNFVTHNELDQINMRLGGIQNTLDRLIDKR